MSSAQKPTTYVFGHERDLALAAGTVHHSEVRFERTATGIRVVVDMYVRPPKREAVELAASKCAVVRVEP